MFLILLGIKVSNKYESIISFSYMFIFWGIYLLVKGDLTKEIRK